MGTQSSIIWSFCMTLTAWIFFLLRLIVFRVKKRSHSFCGPNWNQIKLEWCICLSIMPLCRLYAKSQFVVLFTDGMDGFIMHIASLLWFVITSFLAQQICWKEIVNSISVHAQWGKRIELGNLHVWEKIGIRLKCITGCTSCVNQSLIALAYLYSYLDILFSSYVSSRASCRYTESQFLSELWEC